RPRAFFLQPRDIDERLTCAPACCPQHADQDAVSRTDDGDRVAQVAVDEQGLGPAEPAELANRQRCRRERREGATSGCLLAEALDDLGPEELSLLEHRLVDRGLDALGRLGEQLADARPVADLRDLQHQAPPLGPSARSANVARSRFRRWPSPNCGWASVK